MEERFSALPTKLLLTPLRPVALTYLVNKGLGMLGGKGIEKNWDWISHGKKAQIRVVGS